MLERCSNHWNNVKPSLRRNFKVSALYFPVFHADCGGRESALRDTSEQPAFSGKGEKSWRYNDYYGRSIFFCAAFHDFPRGLRRLLQCAARYLRADSFFPERVRDRGYITLLTHIKSQSNISRLRKSWPLETDLKHPRASVFQAGALAGPHSRARTRGDCHFGVTYFSRDLTSQGRFLNISNNRGLLWDPPKLPHQPSST